MSVRYRVNFGNLEDSILVKTITIFINENVEFKRDEQDGFISIRSNKLPRLQELFFNPTALEVIKKCDGKTSILTIIEEM